MYLFRHTGSNHSTSVYPGDAPSLQKKSFTIENLGSFCIREPDAMNHFFYDCSYSNSSWKIFESYYLSLTKQQVHTISTWYSNTRTCTLLNHLLLVGKRIYLWRCRRNEVASSTSFDNVEKRYRVYQKTRSGPVKG